MYADPSQIRISLEDWECDLVDAEAAACGMTRQEMLHELVRDGLAFECMDGLSTTWDRQWKSH